MGSRNAYTAGSFFRFFWCLAGALILFASCIKDNCRDTVCRNGGLCVDGKCACASGYLGGLCEEPWNMQFEGSWTVHAITADSALTITERTYPVRVTPGPSADTFLLLELEQMDMAVVCTPDGPLAFRFGGQYSNDSSFFMESGQGRLDTVTGAVEGRYVFLRNGSRYTGEMKWRR